MLRLLSVVHKQHTHTGINTCTHSLVLSLFNRLSRLFVCSLSLSLSLAHAWLRYGFVYGAPFNVVVVFVVVVVTSHLPAAARQRRRRLKLWVEENPNRQATHQHTRTLVHTNTRVHTNTHRHACARQTGSPSARIVVVVFIGVDARCSACGGGVGDSAASAALAAAAAALLFVLFVYCARVSYGAWLLAQI